MNLLLIFTIIFGYQTFAQDLVQGTKTAEYEKLKRLSDFDEVKPGIQTLAHLIRPLSKTELPFDRESLKAINFAGVYVTKNYQLTTLHRLPIENQMGGAQPFFERTRLGPGPISYTGLGTFLFELGHPKLLGLKAEGFSFQQAINKIPLAERPGIV